MQSSIGMTCMGDIWHAGSYVERDERPLIHNQVPSTQDHQGYSKLPLQGASAS